MVVADHNLAVQYLAFHTLYHLGYLVVMDSDVAHHLVVVFQVGTLR